MSTQTGHDPLQQSDFNNLSKVDVGPLYSSLLDKTCCKERERELVGSRPETIQTEAPRLCANMH